MSVPRIGFMPGDYSEEAEGVLVGSVTQGGPAEKGGMKDGDRIVAVNGESVKNMTMYMTVMGKRKPKEPVEITVDRKGEKVKLTVTPQ
jgi:S1-C subfamily serine protease